MIDTFATLFISLHFAIARRVWYHKFLKLKSKTVKFNQHHSNQYRLVLRGKH